MSLFGLRIRDSHFTTEAYIAASCIVVALAWVLRRHLFQALIRVELYLLSLLLSASAPLAESVDLRDDDPKARARRYWEQQQSGNVVPVRAPPPAQNLPLPPAPASAGVDAQDSVNRLDRLIGRFERILSRAVDLSDVPPAAAGAPQQQ